MIGFDVEFSGSDESGEARILVVSSNYNIGKRLRGAPRMRLEEFGAKAKHVYFNRAETSFFTELEGERIEVHVADEADVFQRQGHIEVAIKYSGAITLEKAQAFAHEVLKAAFEDRQTHSSRALAPQPASVQHMKEI